MAIPTKEQIEHFLHAQLEHWHAKNRDGFLGAYREMSPNGLTVEYVGRPLGDGWQAIEDIWEKQVPNIEVEVQSKIINGSEAACLHANKIIGTNQVIPTIEQYIFGDGTLHVRYYVGEQYAANPS